MSRADTNQLIDEYEQDVEDIVATCDGDTRAALKALLLVNERLENALQRLSANEIRRCRSWVKMRNTHAEHNRSALTLIADV